MSERTKSAVAGYGLAILMTVIALLLRWALDPLFRDTAQFLVFYFSVMLVAVWAGTRPGLLAIVLGSVAGTWLFVHLGHVGAGWTDDLTRLAFFIVFGLLVMFPAGRLHAAHRQAVASAREYRIVADNTHAWEFWLAPDGRFLYCSPACRRITGYDAEAFMGDPHLLDRIIHADDQPLYREHRGQDLEGCATEQVEFRIVRSDGAVRWISHACQPIYGEDSRYLGIRGSNRDITDAKEAQAALTAAKAEAERAAREAQEANSIKDRFLAVLSHELRTPLTPVTAGMAMLHDRAADPDTRELLAMMQRNIELEASLIDDLLDVTRIAHGKIELNRQPVRLGDVLSRAVSVCQPDIEARGLHFDVDLGSDSPCWVHADPVRLQQVFWNLLRNAIKFTPCAGCIGVRCRTDGEHVDVEVWDSGEGIEPGALARIFNAFEQEEHGIQRQFGGLGLGLTISKTLMEMHGGTIEAHSDGKGTGAVFRVRLPLSIPTGQAGTVAGPTPAPTPSIRPLRILLVEDHGDTARMMRRLLSFDGHQVHTAGDVATALRMAECESFDLLLSDLGLPDASGLDLMRELRARGCNMPGIALSGYGQEQDVRDSHAAGFAAHLTKPASPDRLAKTIAAVAARREVIYGRTDST